jgi:hypothetical protein
MLAGPQTRHSCTLLGDIVCPQHSTIEKKGEPDHTVRQVETTGTNGYVRATQGSVPATECETLFVPAFPETHSKASFHRIRKEGSL